MSTGRDVVASLSAAQPKLHLLLENLKLGQESAPLPPEGFVTQVVIPGGDGSRSSGEPGSHETNPWLVPKRHGNAGKGDRARNDRCPEDSASGSNFRLSPGRSNVFHVKADVVHLVVVCVASRRGRRRNLSSGSCSVAATPTPPYRRLLLGLRRVHDHRGYEATRRSLRRNTRQFQGADLSWRVSTAHLP